MAPQEAFPLIRSVFLIRGVMDSLGVSTSMAVAWEPTARRVLKERGCAVEPMFLVLARRAALGAFWVFLRWLTMLVQLTRTGSMTGAATRSGRGSKAALLLKREVAGEQ